MATTNARDDIISAAIDLVRRQGVSGTAITDVISHSGRARRTIYLNFPGGKQQLIEAATRTAADQIDGLVSSIVERTTTRSDLIAQIARAWQKIVQTSRFRAGCPIAAAALGRADAPEAADLAGQALLSWIDQLADAIIERDRTDPETARRIATTIVAAVEGAIIMSLATESTQPIEDIAAVLSGS